MPPPASVKFIGKSGRSGLASSNEKIAFKISRTDLKELLAKKQFKESPSLVETNSLNYPQNMWIGFARKSGIIPDRAYTVYRDDNGIVFIILITNEKMNRAMTFYFK